MKIRTVGVKHLPQTLRLHLSQLLAASTRPEQLRRRTKQWIVECRLNTTDPRVVSCGIQALHDDVSIGLASAEKHILDYGPYDIGPDAQYISIITGLRQVKSMLKSELNLLEQEKFLGD